MKTYRTETKQVKVIDKHICDVCKHEIKPKDTFDATITEVEARIGNVFPGGSSRTIYRIDICGDCFEDRLVPLVEEHLSVKWQEEDED